MTTAERWRQEGRTEGIERGIEQGIEQGVQRGHHERTRLLLARLLSFELGPLPARITDALDAAELDTLERCFEECLTADALTAAEAMIASTAP